ncbi:MAG: helix-turn-helix domain-containing protein [Rhabdaerophilum sp.]|jgi:predicted transcriptional regulator
MQIETSINAIEARAKRIGLSLTELARLAGIAASTLLRHKSTHNPQLSTLEKINVALVAEERRVLAHLIALHPDLSSLPAGGPVTFPSPVTNPVARNGHGAFSSEAA